MWLLCMLTPWKRLNEFLYNHTRSVMVYGNWHRRMPGIRGLASVCINYDQSLNCSYSCCDCRYYDRHNAYCSMKFLCCSLKWSLLQPIVVHCSLMQQYCRNCGVVQWWPQPKFCSRIMWCGPQFKTLYDHIHFWYYLA